MIDGVIKILINIIIEHGVHIFNPKTWEADAHGVLWVWGKPVKMQASCQGCIMKLWLSFCLSVSHCSSFFVSLFLSSICMCVQIYDILFTYLLGNYTMVLHNTCAESRKQLAGVESLPPPQVPEIELMLSNLVFLLAWQWIILWALASLLFQAHFY